MDWLKTLTGTRRSSRSDQDFPVATRKTISGVPPMKTTDATILSSQGLIQGDTPTASMLHISTSPNSYYQHKYGAHAAGGINMDRGGFGHALDGTNFGAVFDGVTAGGAVNAHAAQAFTDYTLRWFSQHKDVLSNMPTTLQPQLKLLFEQATSYENNPGGDHQAEGGSATAVVATFRRVPGPDVKFQLIGGYVGDAACVVLHPAHGARLVTKSRRREGCPSDTGGQLMMCMGISGKVLPLVHPIVPGTLVILTTDGFTDNVHRRDIENIVPLIVESTFFQDPVPTSVGLKHPGRLPDYEELFNLLRAAPRSELTAVTCHDATTRLGNYVQWVTRSLKAQEERFYTLSTELDEWRAKGQAENGRAQALEHQLEQLIAARGHSKLAGKTDDCLLCVMKPYHSPLALKRT
eukprot:m.236559 g.236559  ORF g.236559 m.236559 type:complete len:407 (-) comp17414_c0_seq3:2731-3951(-)